MKPNLTSSASLKEEQTAASQRNPVPLGAATLRGQATREPKEDHANYHLEVNQLLNFFEERFREASHAACCEILQGHYYPWQSGQESFQEAVTKAINCDPHRRDRYRSTAQKTEELNGNLAV